MSWADPVQHGVCRECLYRRRRQWQVRLGMRGACVVAEVLEESLNFVPVVVIRA